MGRSGRSFRSRKRFSTLKRDQTLIIFVKSVAFSLYSVIIILVRNLNNNLKERYKMTIMDLFLVTRNHQQVRIDNANEVLYIGDAILIPTDLLERNVTSMKILDEFTIQVVCI